MKIFAILVLAVALRAQSVATDGIFTTKGERQYESLSVCNSSGKCLVLETNRKQGFEIAAPEGMTLNQTIAFMVETLIDVQKKHAEELAKRPYCVTPAPPFKFWERRKL